MDSPRNEYLKRASASGLAPLTPLHHQVMDRVFAEFGDGFTIGDALRVMQADQVLASSELLRDRRLLIKVIVANALRMLVASGMLHEANADNESTYQFVWRPR